MNRKALTALAVLSVSSALGVAFAAPSFADPAPHQNRTAVSSSADATPSASVTVGFEGNNFTLPASSQSSPPHLAGETPNPSTVWTWSGTPGNSASNGSGGTATTALRLSSVPCAGGGSARALRSGLSHGPVRVCLSAAVSELPVAPGTTPSVTALSSTETAIAFQGSNGDLWTWAGDTGSEGTAVDQGVKMWAGTSPSIVAGSFSNTTAVAFQASTGVLETWSGDPADAGTAVPTPFGMAPGTSPSITFVLSNAGDAAVAFQGSDHDLWGWIGNPATAGSAAGTAFAVAAGTSPSISFLGSDNDTTAVAFQGGDGDLWTWDANPEFPADGSGTSTGLSMATGTSPSITGFDKAGSIGVAVQHDVTSVLGGQVTTNGFLWTWSGNPVTTGAAASSGLEMAPGTSPSITSTSVGGGEAAVAMQANGGVLWTWSGTPGTAGEGSSTGLQMVSDTTPSICNADVTIGVLET
jgi:hypothetical protein